MDTTIPLSARPLANTMYTSLLASLVVPESAVRAIDVLWHEPHRCYHTAGHAGLLWYRHLAHGGDSDDSVIAHAIAYHDAIYQVGMTDNEARSAALWRSHAADLPAAFRDEVEGAIMATSRHAADHQDEHQQWMVDLDLTPLGEPWALFAANTEALAREAPGKTRPQLLATQQAFMGPLLTLPVLYRSYRHGGALRHTYEATARENLARVMAQ